jgi:hypothetical protein
LHQVLCHLKLEGESITKIRLLALDSCLAHPYFGNALTLELYPTHEMHQGGYQAYAKMLVDEYVGTKGGLAQ